MTALWLGITVIAGLGGLAAGVWLLVLAFREHLGWGLACCFIPFGALAFALKYWEEAKKPFLYSLVSGVLAVIGVLGYSVSTVNAELGEFGSLGGSMIDEGRPLSAAIDVEPMYSPEPFEDDEPVVEQPEGEAPDIEVEALQPQDEPEEESAPEARPDRPRGREKGVIVDVSDLHDMTGELVQLLLTSGERMSVRVDGAEGRAVRVRQRVGGGSVAYTIKFEDIVEVRSRKEP